MADKITYCTTRNGHGQTGWSPIDCEGLYFQPVCKHGIYKWVVPYKLWRFSHEFEHPLPTTSVSVTQISPILWHCLSLGNTSCNNPRFTYSGCMDIYIYFILMCILICIFLWVYLDLYYSSQPQWQPYKDKQRFQMAQVECPKTYFNISSTLHWVLYNLHRNHVFKLGPGLRSITMTIEN